MKSIALFDLDHTLLSGDSDVLWCSFLMDRGVLERETFDARNRAMEAAYKSGTVRVEDFANFYVGTLAGRTAAQWEPLRRAFLAEEVLPRIPDAARAVVRHHQAAGDLVVMTTATNRFITELTAQALAIDHLLATEVEVGPDGVFTGHTRGVLNMREGKVVRLIEWLNARGERLHDFRSTAYSDSINDLPLLKAVDHAVVVDADPALSAHAAAHGWRAISLR